VTNHLKRKSSISVRMLLLALSIVIGISADKIIYLVHCYYTPRDVEPARLWSLITFDSVTISLPFVVLAALGIARVLPWAVALLLTTLLFGYDLYDAISYWGTGRGVNMGLGFLVLISPAIITIVSLATAYLSDNRSSEGG
jgi:hypothetical protein